MKIKITGGKIVHSPLSFAFSMQELGGSWIQKYNTLLGTYNPDRSLTPYQLKPSLVVVDPDGLTPTGDYATSMTNVVWTLHLYNGSTEETLTSGKTSEIAADTKAGTLKDYYVDDSNAVTIYRNVQTSELLTADFRGDYYNAARKETSHFTWHKDITTQDETDTKITLELRFPSKMNFSAFKNYGQFPIEAVLRNGEAPLAADKVKYKWQVFDYDTKAWKDITADFWYVSGKDTSTIVVDVDFIQKVALRVTGWPTADSTLQGSASTLLRRWYGQYDDTYEFAYAKYLFVDTKQTKAVAKVTNRQGDISNPQKYFDIQMFWRESDTAEWQSLGNGTEFVIEREQLTGESRLGGVCRELSAYQPIELPDGSVLQDNESSFLMGRFPTTEIETE